MMKKLVYLLILIITLGACSDDALNTGTSVLPSDDEIVVTVDTFSITSQIVRADYIYSSSDSMLLGECDSRFGTIHADILTQLACPEGYEYEPTAEVDSVVLYIGYTTWYGDGKSPMTISVYELDKQSFEYTQMYATNLNVNEYWSGDPSTYILDHDKVIVAQPDDEDEESNQYYVRLKTTDDFAQKFFNIQDFSSQEAYTQLFKGLYITSGFGSACMLHVNQISAAVFYHFTYNKAGTDTLVYNEKWFYANTEVRSVNSIQYTNSTFDELQQFQDSVNYIVSPANIYTNLSIPLQEMAQTILGKDDMTNKRPYVNMARLQVEVLNVYSGQTSQMTDDDWAQPSDYMLLVKKSAVERFFHNRELPSDTCAVVSSLLYTTDSLGNTIYYYSFDISSLLTQQLRNAANTSDYTTLMASEYSDSSETLDMMLVPVSVEMSSSTSSVTAIHPKQVITATEIRSAQNSDNPLRLEVVCSGF